MTSKPMTEAQLEAACTQLLQLDGWRPLRTDPCSDRARAKGFGEKGMPDHLYIRYGFYANNPLNGLLSGQNWKASSEVLWIEWKRPGAKPKPHQVQWHRDERLRGALTLIADQDFPATVEGFLGWYRQSGLMRRPI